MSEMGRPRRSMERSTAGTLTIDGGACQWVNRLTAMNEMEPVSLGREEFTQE